MERQLLNLLDYDLRFDEEQAIKHFSYFMPIRSSPQQDRETRQSAVNRIKASRSASSFLNMQLPPTPPDEALPLPPAYSVGSHLNIPASGALGSLDGRSSASTGTDRGMPIRSMFSSASMPTVAEDIERIVENTFMNAEPTKPTCNFGAASTSSGPPTPESTRQNSFEAAPIKPHPYRASSYHVTSVHQRRGYQCEPRQSLQTSITMPSIPRLRESVSNGFLSRVFGTGGSGKDKGGLLSKTTSVFQMSDVELNGISSLPSTGHVNVAIRAPPPITRPYRYV